MTCIIAIKEGDRIYFGGDSCISGKHERVIGRPKIIKKGEFLIGGAGVHRTSQILTYAARIPNILSGEDHYHYLVNTFAGSYRKTLKEQGRLKKVEGIEQSDTSFLIGFRGRIYYMGIDFGIDEHQLGYSAIGSGDSYALGSLYATEKAGLSPDTRIKLALDAACKFNGFVSPPYEILSIDWKGKEHGDKFIFYDSDGTVKEEELEDDFSEV